jgi:hypothetical protein
LHPRPVTDQPDMGQAAFPFPPAHCLLWLLRLRDEDVPLATPLPQVHRSLVQVDPQGRFSSREFAAAIPPPLPNGECLNMT